MHPLIDPTTIKSTLMNTHSMLPPNVKPEWEM